MSKRTLEQALVRAENLRNFQKANEVAFEKSDDYQDIVNLADEVKRLRTMIDDEPFSREERDEARRRLQRPISQCAAVD